MSELLSLIEQFEGQVSPEIQPDRGKILVIDDEPGVRQGLARTLGLKGYSVATVTNGRDGVNLLDDSFDVVILDVKLPRMDGTEVYRQLKAKRAEVPIIFFSAHPGDQEKAQECLSLDPYGFVEKGVKEDVDKLYRLIERAAG